MRNEEKSLPALAEALLEQTLLPAEIIIINGGSTDKTLAIAKDLAAQDARFRVLDVGDATPGRGRNLGAVAARNEWIAFTDAGTHAEPGWLEHLAAVVEREPSVEVVYGNYELVVNSFFERCAALAYPPAKQSRPGGRMRGPSTASMMLRRNVWQKVGGFPDLRASEDLIFMKRIEDGGFKVGWAPKATTWWQMQPNIARTFRKFLLYSKHNVWAGRQSDWHYGIARQYTVVLILIALAIFHSPWWLLLIAAGFSARVGRSIWRRKEGRGVLWALNPAQFLGVAVILLTIDLATFIGWAQAAWGGDAPCKGEPTAIR